MNEELTMQETEITDEVEIYETEKSGGGFLKVLGVGTAVVAGVVAALCYKNRDKIEAKRIEKLRKKGYVIYKAEEVECVEAVEVQEELDEE